MSGSDMSGSDMSGSDFEEVVEQGAGAPAAPPGFVAAEVRRLDAVEAVAGARGAAASLPRGKRKRKVAIPATGGSNMVAQLLGGFKRSAGWDGGVGPVARAVAGRGGSIDAGDAMSPATPATPMVVTGASKFTFGFAGTKTSTTPAASSLRELLQRTKATAAQQASWQPTQGAGLVQVSPLSVAKTPGDETESGAGGSIRMPLTRTSSRSPPTLPSFAFSPARPTPVDGAGRSPTMLAIAFSTAADAAAAAPRFSFADAVPPSWREMGSAAASNDVATTVTKATRDDVSDNDACAPGDSSNRVQEELHPASRLRVLQRAKVRQGKSMKSAPAGELKVGAIIEVITSAVLPDTGVVRVKFSQPGGLIGWCSMTTAAGEILLEKIAFGEIAQHTGAAKPSIKRTRRSTGSVVTLPFNSAKGSNPGQSKPGANGGAGSSICQQRDASEKVSGSPATTSGLVRSARPVKSVEELGSVVPFPAADFLAALTAAEVASEQTDNSSKSTQSKRRPTVTSSLNQATELRALMLRRMEGIFAKCVLPDGSPGDHIASDRPVEAERAAMAASLVACMSPEQIAEMIENTEKSHVDASTAKVRLEARRQRRHSMDAAIAV